MRKILLYLSIKYNGNWDLIFESLNQKKKLNHQEVEHTYKSCKNNFVTILDNNYPEKLKKIDRPPFVIYYKGNLDLLNSEINGIYFNSPVNNENYSTVRKYMRQNFKEKNKIVLVNKNNFLELKKIYRNFIDEKTIGILPSGIDFCSDPMAKPLYNQILNSGLLISEFPNKIHNRETEKESLKLYSALSKEILMPKVFKNLESYNLLTFCIDNDNQISTIENNKEKGFANNFLIQEGAKNILMNHQK